MTSFVAENENSLDRYASRVSPPPKNDSFRRVRHNLRNAASEILGREHRISKCGRVRTAQTVDLNRSKVGANFAGLSTCGSVWNCPVCSSKIAEGRKDEAKAACERHQAGGGAIYMATFTVPHTRNDSLSAIRGGMNKAWARLIQGKGWVSLKSRFAIEHYIKAIEVTVGKSNGWHPHIHILFFTSSELSDERQTFLKQSLFQRWEKQVEKQELGACSFDAFDLVKSKDGEGAAHYVAKWGAGSEISKGSSKKANSGNCAPWELLALYHKKKDGWAWAKFQEYAEEMHGARQLTWSGGLKDKYNISEVSDEVLAAKEMEIAQIDLPLPENLPEGRIGIFSKGCWSQIVIQKLTADVLDAGHSGGWDAVITLLNSKGIVNTHEKTGFSQPPINDTRARAERLRNRVGNSRKETTQLCKELRDNAPRGRLQRITDEFFNSGRH